jgi:hypothetical protein
MSRKPAETVGEEDQRRRIPSSVAREGTGGRQNYSEELFWERRVATR